MTTTFTSSKSFDRTNLKRFIFPWISKHFQKNNTGLLVIRGDTTFISLLNLFTYIVTYSDGQRGRGREEGCGRTKGSSFVLFWDTHFWHTNFEGAARAKKRDFLVKFSKLCLKTLFFGPFFQNFAWGTESLTKIGCFSASGELGKSIWSRVTEPNTGIAEK